MKKKIDLSASKDSSEKDMTVFVGGLPFSTSEEQIQKDFEECGPIEKFNLPKGEDGRPRGIAFITYATQEGVDAALKFDGDDYGGRTLKVNLASDKSSIGKGKDGKGKGKDGKGKDGKGKGKGDRNDALTVRVVGLSWDLSQETVEKDFKECGEVTRCVMPKNEEGRPKGFAFIEFKDEEGLKKALEFNEQEYGGRTIYVSKADDAGSKGKDGKGKDGKGKDGKGKGKDGKGKGKDKGKKGKKDGMSDGARAARDGSMVEPTGTKQTFADSDEEEEAPPKKKAKVAKPADDDDDSDE